MDSDSGAFGRLGLRTFLSVYLRSFFSQGSFSAAYRQNIGLAFCLEPVGRRLFGNEDDYRSFLSRHLAYYNGNPFMVTLVLGAVARMEEMRAYGSDMSDEEINRFKNAVGQATGSVGDRFFWRTLRPFALVLGLLTMFAFERWGVLVFLLAFNVPVLILRWHWLMAGYRLGPKVVIKIRSQFLDRAATIMECMGAFILSFLAVAFLGRDEYGLSWTTVCTLGIFLVSVALLKRQIPHAVVFPVVTVIAIVAGIALFVL